MCNALCLLTSILAPAAGQQGHTTTPQELTLLEDVVAYGLPDEVPWPSTQASCSIGGRNSSSTQLRLAELLPFVHSSPGDGVPPVGPHSKPAIDPLVDALRQLQARPGRRESSGGEQLSRGVATHSIKRGTSFAEPECMICSRASAVDSCPNLTEQNVSALNTGLTCAAWSHTQVYIARVCPETR